MENIKEIVKEKYSQIAAKSDSSADSGCCCGPSCCGTTMDYTVFSDSYENQAGL